MTSSDTGTAQPGLDRTGTGWRIAQVAGSIVAALVGLYGLGAWGSAVFHALSYGHDSAGQPQDILTFIFSLSLVFCAISGAILIGLFGLRRLVSKITIGAYLFLVVSGITVLTVTA